MPSPRCHKVTFMAPLMNSGVHQFWPKKKKKRKEVFQHTTSGSLSRCPKLQNHKTHPSDLLRQVWREIVELTTEIVDELGRYARFKGLQELNGQTKQPQNWILKRFLGSATKGEPKSSKNEFLF